VRRSEMEITQTDNIVVLSVPGREREMDTLDKFDNIITRLNSSSNFVETEIEILEVDNNFSKDDDDGEIPNSYGARLFLPKSKEPNIEERYLKMCTEFLYEVVDFSRTEQCEFEVLYNSEIIGEISFGIMSSSVEVDFLSEWRNGILKKDAET